MEDMAILSICLDTKILIDTLRGDEETVKQIKEIETSGIILSTTTINAFELFYGAEKTENRERNKEALRKLLERLLIYDFTEKASEKAGEIAANLEAEGKTIDFRDIFIGATVLINESIIFTKDIDHFERIPDLKLHV